MCKHFVALSPPSAFDQRNPSHGPGHKCSSRLEAIASRVEVMAITVKVIAGRLEAVGSGVEAIAIREGVPGRPETRGV